MLTGHEFVVGAVATGVILNTQTAFAKPSQPMTRVNFVVPPGACDCHTHIHGDPAQFPFFAGRVYTPEVALPDEMAALHKALGIQRVVIVTPSVYGTDNSSSLYGMKARGNDARGVAVIDDKTPESELDALHQAGMRGIRLNLKTVGIKDPAVAVRMFQDSAERMKKRNWHIQLNVTMAMLTAIKAQLAASPVPLVFDHFAGAEPEKSVDQPGFPDLLDLVRSGTAYVKISVTEGPRHDYTGFIPLAKALIAANQDRILWGTNWPHPNSVTPPGRKPTDLTPLWQVDDGLVLNLLPVWAPDPAVRKKILVDNPARLYGF
jgi:predicted TIM-barrel fold metal-dependent hydrolase